MASVSFSFNLDPVASGASQNVAAPSAESSGAIAAKYEAAQAGLQDHSAMAGVSIPACEPGDCFIVHGEGPGVTTLSTGEEDGGAGDFFTLPVLDGVGFLERPAPSFVGVADFNITLAIGEDSGGGATSVAGIGTDAQPVASSQQVAMEPIYETLEIGSITPVQSAQAELGPIQTMPIVEPRAKPESVVAATTTQSTDVASAQPGISALEASPVAEPRVKPEVLTSFSFPLPDLKPASIAVGGVETTPSGGAVGEASTGSYVSVGDYDSYLASLGGGESAGSTEIAGNAATIDSVVNDAATPSSVVITYNSPPPAPEVAAPSSVVISYNPPPPAPIVAAPERIEMTLQPASAAPVESIADVVVAPRMKPASFTIPGPASLAPIQTVPIETVPIETVPIQTAPTFTPAPVASETFVLAPQAQPVAETGLTFTTVDGPVPMGKPEGAAADAPRLSDEDFRITTLAYGEEDAGGG